MTARRLNVLVLFDVPYAPPNDLEPEEFMVGDEWEDERDVVRTLRKLGHHVSVFGIFDDIQPLIERVKKSRPDVIFNQCESFRADRDQEANLPALLELLGIPYTGAKPEALSICKDKGLTKKILTYHHIRVPRFAVSSKSRPTRRLGTEMAFPAIVKPLKLDSSVGLAHASLVADEEEALERIAFLHEKHGCDAIVEEYIDGRELYIGVFGNERLTVLPPMELYFKRLPEGTPRFLTYKAKWDRAYRKRYGIDSDTAKAVTPKTLERINEACRAIYRLCKITGYARIDLRLAGEPDSADLVPAFLEANPNPSIKKQDDFAWAAKRAGIPYDELLERLIHLALNAA